MAVINIHQAKSQLSKLLKRAQAGEEVIIAKAGKPVARLVAVSREADFGCGLWLRKYPARAAELDRLGEAVLEPLPADELALWEK